MKKALSALCLCLVAVAYAGAIPTTWLEARTASQLGITSFNEAPMLAALVASGDLPPVAERLPDDPLVLEPLNEIGTYGGTISASNTGGWSDLGHVRLSYLFTTDPSCSAVIPDVAKGYDLSADGTELTIYLREGMKWSDGAPLTADDVMYFYNDVVLNDEINHWVRFVWTIGGELATFEKLDDYAFRIKMAIPYRPVLSMINHWYTLPSFFMMPSHFAKQFHIDHNPKANELAKELGHENWVDAHSKELNVFPNVDALKKVPTLGTWVMETDVQLKKTFARNPYYHVVDTAGNQLPYIDRVVVNIVSDQQVTILDALQGKSDVAGPAAQAVGDAALQARRAPGQLRAAQLAAHLRRGSRPDLQPEPQRPGQAGGVRQRQVPPGHVAGAEPRRDERVPVPRHGRAAAGHDPLRRIVLRSQVGDQLRRARSRTRRRAARRDRPGQGAPTAIGPWPTARCCASTWTSTRPTPTPPS